MANYQQDAIDARATLREDGQLCRVRVFTDVDYDSNNSLTARHWKDTYVWGAIFDYASGAMAIEEIESGDKQLLLAADVVITPGNTNIKVGEVEYKVVGVKEVNPAGIVVMYDLHLRK